MGFAEVLTLILVLLKITHVIDWSWWWVLAPEIAAAAVYFGFFVVALQQFLAVAKAVKQASKRQ